MKQIFSLITLIAAFPAIAENARELDAHKHGVGIEFAIDGTTVAMAFEAPGADIVGFEYAAESGADLAAIDAAVSTLGAPLDLFVMSDAANCSLVDAQAALEGEDGHDDHDEEDHNELAEEGSDDRGDDDHADEAGHTEFHAKYTLTCDKPDALTEIKFTYFDAFPNAKEVEVQIITTSDAQAFEVRRDAPVLDLGR